MKSQPNRNYVSCDDVQTPIPLAFGIVQHFKPYGTVLEPCAGEGAFVRALTVYNEQVSPVEKTKDVDGNDWTITTLQINAIDTMEIKGMRDFLLDEAPLIYYDYIVTNPPWSKIRPFLQRSMQLADNVIFLMTVNHAFTKARIRDVKEAGFGIREILLCEMPKEFPQSGFQLGAVHYQRGWKGDIKLSSL